MSDAPSQASRPERSGSKVRPFATNGGLIRQLRRGVTGLRAVREVFRQRPADAQHLRSLVFQGVDPDLLSVMLGRQLAADWVPPLWRLYHELRAANGPAFRADVFAAWARVRGEWVPLWTQLRERLAAAIADSGSSESSGSSVSSTSRASGRPPRPSSPGPSQPRRDSSVSREAGSGATAADPAGSPDSTGAVHLGVHGSDRLVSIDGAVHRIADPGAAAVDPAMVAALSAMRGVMLRTRAGEGVGAERPAPSSSTPKRRPASPPRLPPVPETSPATVVTVPVSPSPLPDFRAIAGVVPGYPPPFLFQLWLAMRSSPDDVMRLREAWIAMGGNADLWDQWMWPLAPAEEWAEHEQPGR